MAQLLKREVIGGRSSCLLASWLGFPVIQLNSKKSNQRKLLRREKEKDSLAAAFDKFGDLVLIINCGSIVWEVLCLYRGFTVTYKPTQSHTHIPFFRCSPSFDASLQCSFKGEAISSGCCYSSVWASVCLEFRYTTCISHAAGFVEIQEFAGLVYSPVFVYCLRSVNIKGRWLGKHRRDKVIKSIYVLFLGPVHGQ